MKKEAYLLTGSNLYHPLKNITTARTLISQQAGAIIGQSSVYETAPWGDADQSIFVNQVLHIRTALSAQKLMTQLLAIEEQMGRIRWKKWGPRLIDIDILTYGDDVIEEENLMIPHPRISERRFTLAPFAEIAPDLILPTKQKTIARLLEECTDSLTVTKLLPAHE